MSLEKQNRLVYEFGPFRLDAGERVLLRGDAPVRVRQKDREAAMLTPKVVETLLALVERGGRIVSKEELMETVWPDTAVEESNLASNISLLRRALGTMDDGRPYIETFSKRGYRFNAPLREAGTEVSIPFNKGLGPDGQTRVDVGAEVPELIIRRRTRAHIVTDEEEAEEDGTLPDDDRSLNSENEPRRVGRLVVDGKSVAEATSLTRTERGALAPADARRRRWKIVAASALAVALAVATIVAWRLYGVRGSSGAGEPFSRSKLSRVTSSGRATHAAVSPDGQFVAHVQGGVGNQSLWLRHLVTGSDKEIVPPGKETYTALAFSRDGSFIYYVRYAEESGLYQVPVLGGAPKVLAKDTVGGVTFSPDGKQFAFIRSQPAQTEEALIVGHADGGEERELVTHKGQWKMFPAFSVASWGPAWSPDGKSIAFGLRTSEAGGRPSDASGKDYWRVMLARVADGTETPLTSYRWSSIGQMAWLPDGSGLVVAAAEQGQGSPHQLWHVSYPDGEARKITNDSNNYYGVSLTNDATALVTVQAERRTNIWVAPEGDASRADGIPSDSGDGMSGLDWTPDGRMVYVSNASGNQDIWIMDADGNNRKQLTTSAGMDSRPTVSSDGRYIVFTSDRAGNSNVWRMETDGSNPKQLTNGRGDFHPSCSPDNQWVFYASDDSGRRTLWKVPMEGGAPAPVTDYLASLPAVSPDGKFIAYVYIDERENDYRAAVIPYAGGQPLKTFDLAIDPQQVVRWTPDGRALAYIVTRNGVSNIWHQPLDGGPPAPLTDFRSEVIFRYAFSTDGKQLALSRGTVNSDVVMISSLQPE